jgi:hypothetical protein
MPDRPRCVRASSDERRRSRGRAERQLGECSAVLGAADRRHTER